MSPKPTESSRLLDLIWQELVQGFNLQRKTILPDPSFEFLCSIARSDGFIITKKHLFRLVDSRYIAYDPRTDQIRILRKGLLRLVILCSKKTYRFTKLDPRLCIVSFDIPEKYRGRREDFRRFLKAANFTRVHKSTWTHDRDLGLHVKYAASLFGLGDFVVVYVGEVVSGRK